jgi:hypothetical protein
MSKVKIEGNASGTGTFTIAAPNSNTDRSITLPDAAGELLLANGDGSNLTNLPGGGKVLQVVTANSTTVDTTASSTFSNTSLSASITPSSASNKIFAIATVMTGGSRNDQNIYGGVIRLYESVTTNTKLSGLPSIGINDSANQRVGGMVTAQWLHSPASTSTLTYYVQFKVFAGTAYINSLDGNATWDSDSTITLMEIAA